MIDGQPLEAIHPQWREDGYFRPIIEEVVERYLDCGNKITEGRNEVQKHQKYQLCPVWSGLSDSRRT